MTEEKIFDRRTVIKIVLGSLLGGLTLFLAFQGVSFSRLGRILVLSNPWLVTAGLVIVLLNVAILGVRWWVMLLREWRLYDYLSLIWGLYIGQMFNILLPARLGELARVYFVGERTKVTKSRLFGSVVLEKVIDLITFGGAFLLLILGLSLPGWVTEPGWTLIWLAVISLIGVIVLTVWGHDLLAWITPWLARLPSGWGDRLAGILERALEGFDSMRDWKRQFPIWLLSLFSLFLSTLTNYLILLALDLKVSIVAALFVLIVLQIGSAPPSAPGKLGVFHYLAVLALSAYGVGKEPALAYGVLLYVVALLPKVLIGVLVLLFSRWKIPDLSILREGQ